MWFRNELSSLAEVSLYVIRWSTPVSPKEGPQPDWAHMNNKVTEAYRVERDPDREA